MGTARQLSDFELQEIELRVNNNEDLGFLDEVTFDEDKLNALTDRKLEEAMGSLYGECKLLSEEEVDVELEKIFLKAEQNVQNKIFR